MSNAPLPMELEDQLVSLSKLQPNWDSYGSKAVSRDCIDTVRIVLGELIKYMGITPPHLIPTADGGIWATWDTVSEQVTMSFGPSGQYELYVERAPFQNDEDK